jgi:hypothetical protein
VFSQQHILNHTSKILQPRSTTIVYRDQLIPTFDFVKQENKHANFRGWDVYDSRRAKERLKEKFFGEREWHAQID